MSPAAPTLLSAELEVRQHYLRAAHVEHHEGQTVAGYIPTARALEIIHRITRAMGASDAGRAWSLTGPYGAGKSSFALFLHALLGPKGDAAYCTALDALRCAERGLVDELLQARNQLNVSDRGFIRAAATAQREPITDTVLRALRSGAEARWKTRMPADVKTSLQLAAESRAPRAIGQALATIAERVPVVIIIDEFGKNLESFAERPDASDLFVLQELAERCSGAQAVPAFIVTLQHLAFDDYVRTASATQRGEWGKIQGRFEDIPFVENSEQAARLVAAAFTSPKPSRRFLKARQTWSEQNAISCAELGLLTMIPGGFDTIAACYPLHPLALLALPEMCARFGQHGRTLFSFLTSREPYSVTSFLEGTKVDATLPSVMIDRLFDFFINSGGGTNGQYNTRLIEINSTIREATGLSPDELRLLKVVGVLNLLSQGGPLRASRAVLEYALSDGSPEKLDLTIEGLARRGLLTFRGFADEYRLWRGSDLDLPLIVAMAREEISQSSPAALLAVEHKMPPAIAGRHSQRVGMLRYFQTAFADATTQLMTRPTTRDDADGLLVYYLGPPEASAGLKFSDGPKPVLIAATTQYAAVTEAVFELVAVQRALKRDDVQADQVARRELQDRAADARIRLTERIATYLRPNADGVTFAVAGEVHSDLVGELPRVRSLSPLLSVVCDAVYSESPEIRNEMLGRRELTSQAAKARRELLEAMVSRQGAEWLGFSGFGPEKAMYAALLKYTEMHVDTGSGWVFDRPHGRHTGMATAWRVAERIISSGSEEAVGLDRIYAALMDPPVGLKEGAIPVLLTALLLARGEDIAIYQEGTYQPKITAELLERLVKDPARFSVKEFPTNGAHSRVGSAVASSVQKATGLQPFRVAETSGRRNVALLAVAGPLLTFARSLPEYTLRTRRLSSDAEAVRDALLSTREPEMLIYHDLPRGCGLKPFVGASRGRSNDIKLFESRLTSALEELGTAYDELLGEIAELLSVELRLHEGLTELRAQLRGQAAPLIGTLLEPRLRSFILLAAQRELDDVAWLEALANNIVGRPAASWRDEDVARFEIELHGLAGAYRRMLSLHYETFTAKDAGFDARRITMTNPDGTEHASVVWIDHAARPHMEQLIDQACAAVEELLGSRGGEALLAVLADRVLASGHGSGEEVSDLSTHLRSKEARDG